MLKRNNNQKSETKSGNSRKERQWADREALTSQMNFKQNWHLFRLKELSTEYNILDDKQRNLSHNIPRTKFCAL